MAEHQAQQQVQAVINRMIKRIEVAAEVAERERCAKDAKRARIAAMEAKETDASPSPAVRCRLVSRPRLEEQLNALDAAAASDAQRHEDVLRRIRLAMAPIGGSVSLFGSCATGLALPTSDMDVMVTADRPAVTSSIGDEFVSFDDGHQNQLVWLETVAQALITAGITSSTEIIARARVPIVRFVEAESQVEVDLNGQSIDVASSWLLEQKRTLPFFRPVVLALKVFLAQRSFHHTYKGGIGSYLLYAMVAEAAHSERAGACGHPSTQGPSTDMTISADVASCDKLLLVVLERFSGPGAAGRIMELRCPVTGGPLGEKAFRCEFVTVAFGHALESLDGGPPDASCLSRLLRGWPEESVTCTRESLASLLAPPHLQPPAWETRAAEREAAAEAAAAARVKEKEAAAAARAAEKEAAAESRAAEKEAAAEAAAAARVKEKEAAAAARAAERELAAETRAAERELAAETTAAEKEAAKAAKKAAKAAERERRDEEQQVQAALNRIIKKIEVAAEVAERERYAKDAKRARIAAMEAKETDGEPSTAQKKQRTTQRVSLCHNCGQAGHRVGHCPEPIKTIYVGNLAPSMEAATLEAHVLANVASAHSCRIEMVTWRSDFSRPVSAFVLFGSVEQAAGAAEALNGTVLQGRVLVVNLGRRREEAQHKRQRLVEGGTY